MSETNKFSNQILRIWQQNQAYISSLAKAHQVLLITNDPDDESRLNLTINRKPIADWFREQWHKLRYGTRLPQQEEKKSRGFKL